MTDEELFFFLISVECSDILVFNWLLSVVATISGLTILTGDVIHHVIVRQRM